jgi:uncharacterized protein (TIGR04255 family)
MEHAPWPKLSKPPIQEAVLSFSFTPSGASKEDTIENFCASVSKKFPIRKNRLKVQLHGNLDTLESDKSEAIINKTKDGVMLNSTDGKTVIQASLSSFSYHIIEPYRNWPALVDETKEAWSEYVKFFPSFSISKISLRFINKITIPAKEAETNGFKEYIALLPSIPDGMPSTLNSFFLQLNIPNEKNEMSAIVNETFEYIGEESVKFLLDIDAFKPVQYHDNFDRIWKDVEQIRDFKNQIFFSSITERAKNLFI